ncbi:MAG: hypothetical protein ACRECP_05375, partial [Methylocella sp.]
YILWSTYTILAGGGLVGEGFGSIIVGLPWSFFLVEYGRVPSGDSRFFLYFFYVWIFSPIVLDVILFYWFGAVLQKTFKFISSKFISS